MKKLILLLLMAFYVSNWLYGQIPSSQGIDDFPFVSELCYTKSMTVEIRVLENIDVTTLAFADKLKFTTKEQVQTHSETFDEDGDVVHDITTVSHTNMYPKWYTKSYLTRVDKTGVKSYYTTTNQYLPGGWVGGSYTTTSNGSYGSKAGKNYYFQNFSTKALHKYNTYNSVSTTKGYLVKYRFSVPSIEVIQYMESEGFTVTTTNDVITMVSTTRTLIWDTVNNVYIVQLIEGGEVVKTTSTYYTLVDVFGEYLISTEVVIVPSTFTTGDCYETVTTTTYEEYAQACSGQAKAAPISDSSVNLSSADLEIYPNPSGDNVTLSIPKYDASSTLLITDLTGGVILQRKIPAGHTQHDISTSSIASGMYIINVTQGDHIFTSKFVKQ